MQQFYTLFKKEFCGYFQSYFAYAVVFIYLLISTGAAFYGSYTEMHDTALYALFNMQLFVQIALAPALTTTAPKTFGCEWSSFSHTVMPLPLKYHQPVLAKFSAAFLFDVLLSLLLLPFIINTANKLNIDWGGIACAYAGLWAVIFVFCALGCLISSLSKNIISVYLLSLFVMTSVVVINLTGFRSAYTNFLLANVGIGDIMYFLSLGSALLFLNVLVLQIRASSQKHKMRKFSGFAILLLTGVFALCFACYMIFPNKYDLSSNKIYTPHAESKEIIQSLKSPILIDVYISRDYIKHHIEYSRYYQQVMRLLQRYERLSGKKIKLNSLVIEPFSKMENIVLSAGLYYEENIYGSKDYFGAVIRNDKGEGVVIKHFLAARSQYLEKDIDTAILKLSRSEVMKTIGVYMDPFQNLHDFQGFLLNLENDYKLINIPEEVDELSQYLDLLILVNPKELNLSFLLAIDKYIAYGGKVILIFDFATENQSSNTNLRKLAMMNMINRLEIAFDENLTDEGTPSEEFSQSGLPIVLYKAVKFDAKGKDYKVTPIITSGEHTIGVLLEGKFPLPLDEIQQSIPPKDTQIAVLGDVDLLIDDNWIATQAPDKNPYDAIYKSSNIEILRNLIDKMVGNTVYLSLPVTQRQNTFSISEKFYNIVYKINAPEYFRLNDELIQARSEMDPSILQNPDKITQLLRSGEAGQKISKLEMQIENILYNIGKQYRILLWALIISQVFIVPLFLTIMLLILAFWIRRRHEKKIREFMND